MGILAGELDAYTAPLLDDALRNAEADAEMIVLDLRRLDFMDCRGMRVMLQSSERLRRAGRRLVLVRGSRHVDLVFRVTGRSEAVEICDLPPDESVVQLLLRLATNCG